MTVRLTLLAAALALGSAATAQAVTLADLAANQGNMIVAGNTVYSNFSLVSASATTSQVTVDNFTNPDRLRFTSSTWDVSGVSNNDAVISYDLSFVPSGSVGVVGLSFSSNVSGGGIASVAETVIDLQNNLTYNNALFVLNNSANPSLNTGNSGTLTLTSPSNHLRLIKDINVSSGSAGGAASISFVDNSFGTSGSTPPIPEPLSLALLPLALVGLGLRRKLAR